MSNEEIKNKKRALNTIFYGPPGTGKTYKAMELAVNIVDPHYSWQVKNATSM